MKYKIIQLVFALTVIGSFVPVAHSQSQPLCSSAPIKSQSEGSMPIPEKAFTEQAAKKELRKLNKLFGLDGLKSDSVDRETSFVMIEGWYLKRNAIAAKKRGDTLLSSSEFCVFMNNRAFIRH